MITTSFKMFSKLPYGQVSINTLLQEADVSKGDFYYHFKNKEALFIHLVGIMLDKKREFIHEHRSLQTDNNIFSILRESIDSGLKFGYENPHMYAFSEQLMKQRGSAIHKKVMQQYPIEQENQLIVLIENAVRNGEIRSDLPFDVVKKIINHMLTNTVNILQTNSIKEYEASIEFLFMFLESGLKPMQ